MHSSAVNTSRYSCQGAMIFNSIALYVLITSVELSIMLRVYALYARSRTVFYILLSCLIGENVAFLVIDLSAFPQFWSNIIHYPADWPIKGCFYPPVPEFFKACWVPVLGFETVVFVLMSMKCFSYRPLCDVPILLCVWRDGTAYFFVILVALLLCTIAPYISSIFLENWAAIWISAIFSYSGAHLLLNIRALAAERHRLEVLTPVISADIPHITAESASDLLSPVSPLEVHELQPRTRQGPVLPRTFDRRCITEGVRWETTSTGWFREWDVTSFEMLSNRDVQA